MPEQDAVPALVMSAAELTDAVEPVPQIVSITGRSSWRTSFGPR